MSRRVMLVVLAALLAAGAGGLAICAPGRAQITLDPTIKYQKIIGWEVHGEDAFNSGNFEAFPYYRQEMYERTVNEVGINRVRLEIKSGAENTDRNWERNRSGEITEEQWRPLRYATVNDNADPHSINWDGFDFTLLDAAVRDTVLPLQPLLAKRGERLFVNLCYVAFTGQIRNGSYIHDDPEEYAEFVLATYLHMQKTFGFVPDTWEVILEPDNDIAQWTSGVTIGRAIVASARRLEENGFTPRFVAPSVVDMGNAARYFDEMASVPGALKYVSEISYHRYRGATKPHLEAIVERAQAHGIPTSMLEYWFGNGTYKVLHEDLKDGLNSAWQGSSLQTLFNIDVADPKHPKLTLRDDTRTNLQYFRYVRAGAQRIGARSDASAFDPLAFVNTSGAYAVVVKANRGGEISLKGLPAGTYRVSYATEHQSQPPGDTMSVASGGTLVTAIPAAGVLTIFDARLEHPGGPQT